MVDKSIAERIFDGGWAESELEMKLDINFDHLGWDHYDNSLEIYEVADDDRLSPKDQQTIWEAGFSKCYVNHKNKWETHYSWWKAGNKQGEPFKPIDGWRVSYPHKRNDGDPATHVEAQPPSWPKSWFETGACIVKKAIGL